MHNFIRQCEQAEEVQKLWKPKTYDYIGHKVLSYRDKYAIYRLDYKIDPKKFFWIPTRKQLQEMSGLSWWKFDERCNEIRRCLLEDPLSEIEIETKEEAGICVVMEKYFKMWNGKNWEKETIVHKGGN